MNEFHRVEPFEGTEHSLRQTEDGGRIVGLFEVEPLVAGIVLFSDDVVEHEPEFLVLSTCRVGQKSIHGLLGLVQFLSRFQTVTHLVQLFLLS